MTWNDLTDLYSENINTLNPTKRQRAELELFYLKENLQYTFPEAVENPILISITPWEKLLNDVQLGGADSHLAFRRAGDALLNTRKIIDRYQNLPELNHEVNSYKTSLKKEQIIYCFAEWLLKNHWDDVHTSLFNPAAYDLIAQFDKIELYALAIGSPFTLINKENQTDDAATLFKAELGVVLFKLLDEKARNHNTGAAILLADDLFTRTLIEPYECLKDLKISIYFIKSTTEVTEVA